MSWRLPPSRLHALSDLYAEPTSVAALALCFNGFHHARTGFESERIMNRISLKGIAIGAITDIVSSYIVLLPLMIYVMVTLNSSGLPSDKAADAAMEALSSNTLYFFLSWLLGGMCSALGGYVSARIAKHDEILNGGLSSILGIGMGAYALMSGSVLDRWWPCLVFMLLAPALAAFGGHLRSRQNSRHG
jgi:hypothetical protein